MYKGLAIDIRRQKLYYADEATHGGKAGELSTDGTAHRVLISDVNSIPRGLVFDDVNRCPSSYSSDVIGVITVVCLCQRTKQTN